MALDEDLEMWKRGGAPSNRTGTWRVWNLPPSQRKPRCDVGESRKEGGGKPGIVRLLGAVLCFRLIQLSAVLAIQVLIRR